MRDMTRDLTDGLVFADEEIDLGAVGRTLWRHQLVIWMSAMVGMAAAAGVGMMQPNVYEATATLMPIDTSGNRLFPQADTRDVMGGILSSVGMGRDGTVSDKLVTLIRSRSVTQQAIARHHLLPYLVSQRGQPDEATLREAEREVERKLNVMVDGKTGVVSLRADHTNPQAAADIANAFLDELDAFLQANSFSSERRKRDLLERKVDSVAADLRKVEDEVANFQEQNRIVELGAQTQAVVQAYTNLKTELMNKVREEALLKRSVSRNDVQLIGLRQEILQLKADLQSLENGSNDSLLAFKSVPRFELQLERLKRQQAMKQRIYELVSEQLEIAKIEEAKEALSFQVIDRAIAPDKPSGPARGFLLLVAGLGGLLAGVFLVLGLDKMRRAQAPVRARKAHS